MPEETPTPAETSTIAESPVETTPVVESESSTLPTRHEGLVHRILDLIEKDVEAVKAWVEAEEAKI